MRVLDMTRECQYVWDGQWGRVRCGRLAYLAGMVYVGTAHQIYFRCREHIQKPNIGISAQPLVDNIHSDMIKLFKVSTLGYKP